MINLSKGKKRRLIQRVLLVMSGFARSFAWKMVHISRNRRNQRSSGSYHQVSTMLFVVVHFTDWRYSFKIGPLVENLMP